MSVDEIVTSLGELGFSPYEARVYYALVQRSPLNGHEIGKQSGVPTSKVYETLDRLRAKGAVLAYESDPVKYAPRPYRDLLATYSDRVTRTLDKVSRTLATVAMDTDANLTWSITGHGNVIEALRGVVRNAKSEIAAVLDDSAAAELASDLKKAADRGLTVRVSAPPPESSLCMAVGDGSETVVGALTGPTGAAGVWTHHPAVSLLARTHAAAGTAAAAAGTDAAGTAAGTDAAGA
jgi:sugar-specific transcriptional regulator TrmB